MFYCRDNELRKLNKRYQSDQFECVIIYGRRRVGKTALINEFCKDKPTIFFSALNATAQENLESLSKSIYEFKNSDETSEQAPIYKNFDSALSEITKLSSDQRLIFVIDEYPYLAKADKSISSRLQHIIDHTWQSGRLFLILCGSSMSFMEYQVLGYESPLYGRRTAQFKIEALNYKEIAAFCPTLSPEQLSLGITGGIPHYINKLGVNDDIDAALLENLFDTSSYLFEEPENLLKQELREPAMYNSIITAIANGSSRINEIATKVGIDSAHCAKYINVLLDLRNMTAITSGRIERIYAHSVKPYFHEYMGLVFEQMCREYLLNYADDLPIEISEIGQWWGTDKAARKEVQIDIVAAPASGSEYIIGSCKYRNEKIGIDELELLNHYASVFGKGVKYHYFIFSLGGFTDQLLQHKDEVTLLTLDEIYR